MADFPVYVDYGKKNFDQSHRWFHHFLDSAKRELKPHPVEQNEKAGIIIAPRNHAAIPFCNLAIALLYRQFYAGEVVLVWDNLPFLEESLVYQNEQLEPLIREISDSWEIEVIELSKVTPVQDDFSLEEVEALGQFASDNAIWNVRTILENEKLRTYTNLSLTQLSQNARYIKSLFHKHNFDHLVHQSLINNNGPLFKYYGNKKGVRVAAMDASQGLGLVGTNESPGAHHDVIRAAQDILESGFYEQNKTLIKRLVQRELNQKQAGVDRYQSQTVSREESQADAFDVLMPLNIMFDAAALGSRHLFNTIRGWVEETIEFLLDHTTATIAVRQHPHERDLSMYGTGHEFGNYLTEKYGKDGRLKFFYSEDKVNTFQLMEHCKVVLPHTSTIGLEAAMVGKPVVVSADTYYGHSSLAVKPNTPEEYFSTIKKLVEDEDFRRNLIEDVDRDELSAIYFIATSCTVMDTSFGLEPDDMVKWCLSGFKALAEEPEMNRVVRSLFQNRPFSALKAEEEQEQLKKIAYGELIWEDVASEKNDLKLLNQLLPLNLNEEHTREWISIRDKVSHLELQKLLEAMVMVAKGSKNASISSFEEFLNHLPEHRWVNESYSELQK